MFKTTEIKSWRFKLSLLSDDFCTFCCFFCNFPLFVCILCHRSLHPKQRLLHAEEFHDDVSFLLWYRTTASRSGYQCKQKYITAHHSVGWRVLWLGACNSNTLEDEWEAKRKKVGGRVQGQHERNKQSKQRHGASPLERRTAAVIFPACVRVWAAWTDMWAVKGFHVQHHSPVPLR